jgi:hypothetical protein
LEPLAAIRIIGKILRQHLDGDDPIEPGVAGAVDLAHTTGGDQGLEPPSNPNPSDGNARAGAALFKQERCVNCHTPPLYTSNKITLAQGFTPPPGVPSTLDILRRTVGTDPGLALSTRKGTGYYKVPSLKGVWYRPRFLHDGSIVTLEELFDPNRLNDDFVPGGWIPLGQKTRAIRGHRFGLRLTPAERAQLIAFLRTL